MGRVGIVENFVTLFLKCVAFETRAVQPHQIKHIVPVNKHRVALLLVTQWKRQGYADMQPARSHGIVSSSFREQSKGY